MFDTYFAFLMFGTEECSINLAVSLKIFSCLVISELLLIATWRLLFFLD